MTSHICILIYLDAISCSCLSIWSAYAGNYHSMLMCLKQKNVFGFTSEIVTLLVTCKTHCRSTYFQFSLFGALKSWKHIPVDGGWAIHLFPSTTSYNTLIKKKIFIIFDFSKFLHCWGLFKMPFNRITFPSYVYMWKLVFLMCGFTEVFH